MDFTFDNKSVFSTLGDCVEMVGIRDSELVESGARQRIRHSYDLLDNVHDALSIT